MDLLSQLDLFVFKDLLLMEVEIVGLVPEYRLADFDYKPKIPIERVHPKRVITQRAIHCTVANDVGWSVPLI